MTSGMGKLTKTDWIRRTVALMQQADARQMRDIYYLVLGYLGPRFPVPGGACSEPPGAQVQ